MNVHIVCRVASGSILDRMARLLVDNLGWTIGKSPDPKADLQYAIPYLEVRRGRFPFAAYFTHREDVLSGKVRIWRQQAQRVTLRVTSATQYADDLAKYGTTAKITPPLDRDKFRPARRLPNPTPVAGTSGQVYPGGRKGERLLAAVMDDARFEWRGAVPPGGKAWPVPSKTIPWSQMQEFYQGLDVYVCTSLIEGVGYGPIEALACGIPVVIPRGVGVFDELPDTEGIVRYEAGSVAGLRAALDEVLSLNPSSDALRAATEGFTDDAWVEGHRAAFSDAFEGYKPAPKPVKEIDTAGCGVYIVAFGPQARQCAKRLCKSLRVHLPGVAIAVASESALPEADIWIEASAANQGRIAKLGAYDLAPQDWNRVLYLDADTEALQSPAFLFWALEQGWEMCLVHDTPRDTVKHLRRGYNTQEYTATVAEIGSEHMSGVAGGVWSFRRCEATRRFFQAWQEEWARFSTKHDQPALARALRTHPVRACWLTWPWNRFTVFEQPGEDVIIRHWSGGPARSTGDGVGITPGARPSLRARHLQVARPRRRTPVQVRRDGVWFIHAKTGDRQWAGHGSRVYDLFMNSPHWEVRDVVGTRKDG